MSFFQVLTTLHSVWICSDLRTKAPDALMATLLGVYCIERHYTVKTPEEQPPAKEKPSAKPPKPTADPEDLQRLADMGYDRATAEVALRVTASRSGDSMPTLDAAVDWLLNHPEAASAAAEAAEAEAAQAEAAQAEATEHNELANTLSMDPFEENPTCQAWLLDETHEMVPQIIALLQTTNVCNRMCVMHWSAWRTALRPTATATPNKSQTLWNSSGRL